METEKAIAVRIDDEMRASLRKYAKAMDMTVSQIIRKAIRAELAKMKKVKILA